MNYQILKTILDSLIKNFKCPNCESLVSDNEVEIISMANQVINIDVSCPKCMKKTVVKAEMSSLNLANMPNVNPDMIEKLKQKLKQTIKSSNKINLQKTLNEKEIIDLKNVLNKDNLWVDDFFRNI